MTNKYIRNVTLRSNCVVHDDVCISTQPRYLEMSMRLEFLESRVCRVDFSSVVFIVLLHCLWLLLVRNLLADGDFTVFPSSFALRDRSFTCWKMPCTGLLVHSVSLHVFLDSVKLSQTCIDAMVARLIDRSGDLFEGSQLSSDRVVNARLTVDS